MTINEDKRIKYHIPNTSHRTIVMFVGYHETPHYRYDCAAVKCYCYYLNVAVIFLMSEILLN